jgi:hypothetical protein
MLEEFASVPGEVRQRGGASPDRVDKSLQCEMYERLCVCVSGGGGCI